MVEKVNRLKLIFKHGRQLLTVILTSVAVLAPAFVSAQSAPFLISDDETEAFLSRIVKPIFTTAEIPFSPKNIYILADPSLNAFVSDGNRLFIHTGTLLAAENVNELTGVLAHEAGHIAGGHIVRQKLKASGLQNLSIASLIAAAATAAASGRGDAAMAVVLGSQSSLLNAMTVYKLEEERSADESAVKYLKKLNQSPAGLKNFMKKIQLGNRLNGYEETPYFRTHPMSVERTSYFEQAIQNAPEKTASPYDEDFQMIKAKLTAFLQPTGRVLKIYPTTNRSKPARYAHAILYYRTNNLKKALEILQSLSDDEPQNPYFNELIGQFLLEQGQASQAVKAYEKALHILPDSPDIMLGYAQSLLESQHNRQDLLKITSVLNKLQIKKESLAAWLLLARAYDELGKTPEKLYASARYSFAIQNFDAAERQINEALLHEPSPELRLKLNDLKNASEKTKRQNN